MQKNLPKFTVLLIIIIYQSIQIKKKYKYYLRNYSDINHIDNIIELKKFCKLSKNSFYQIILSYHLSFD